MLEELGLPRAIGVASGTETTDREVPVDAHATHVVGHSASEWFDASYVFTHCPSDDIFAGFRTSLVRIALRESERPESGHGHTSRPIALHGERLPTRSSNSRRNGKIARCNDGRF